VRRPALAIGKPLADGPTVLGVVDDRGRVHWRKAVLDDPPNFKAWQHSLGVALRGAQERVAEMSADIGDAASLHRHAMALWARARAEVTAAEPREIVRVAGDDEEVPPDARTKKWRTEANLQAMRLVLAKEPGELTAEDRKILGQYSG